MQKFKRHPTNSLQSSKIPCADSFNCSKACATRSFKWIGASLKSSAIAIAPYSFIHYCSLISNKTCIKQATHRKQQPAAYATSPRLILLCAMRIEKSVSHQKDRMIARFNSNGYGWTRPFKFANTPCGSHNGWHNATSAK